MPAAIAWAAILTVVGAALAARVSRSVEAMRVFPAGPVRRLVGPSDLVGGHVSGTNFHVIGSTLVLAGIVGLLVLTAYWWTSRPGRWPGSGTPLNDSADRTNP